MRNWILGGAALVVAGSAFGVSHARAAPGQNGQNSGGPPATCKADIEKLCAGVKPGAGRILRCLDQHKNEASRRCSSALAGAAGEPSGQREGAHDRAKRTATGGVGQEGARPTGPERSGPGAPPVGLIAVIANKPGQSLNTQTFANPYIVGVSLQIHWADIEKQQGKPDWARLDELVADAQAQNKFVQFFIFPGYFTPDWAQKGVQTDNFPVPYGPQHGKVLPLPMPWDDTYLTRWLAFVKLLSERYGDQPTVKIVAVAGPTSVSDEYTLPVSGPDVKLWEADGYTPSKYLGAWKRVLRAYAADFPNQYLSMSLGGGVDINDMGKFAPAQRKITQQAVATAAANILGDRFTLQYNNLDGKSGPEDTKGITFVSGYVGKAITGYQLRSPASGPGMGDPGMTPQQTMRAAFNKGIRSMGLSQRVDYLQVYQPDVLDPDLQTTLQWGASLFSATPPAHHPRKPCGTHCY